MIARRTTQRDSDLRRRYGITEQDYALMESRQDGRCAICRRIPASSFHIDHCHETGKVRGLLCSFCNKGLGHFRDNEQSLLAAAAYVRAATRRLVVVGENAA